MPKETIAYEKRGIHETHLLLHYAHTRLWWPSVNTNMPKKTYEYVKSDLQTCQKRPTNMTKRVMQMKRGLCTRRVDSCITHTYAFGGRQVIQICPKRPTNMSKETYIYETDLQIRQKRHSNMSKETYTYVQRNL